MKPNSITIQTVSIPTEGENTTFAVCMASGFRPENDVDVSWLFRNTSSVPQSTTSYNLTTDTYGISANFTLNMSRDDNGELLTCVINHISLDEPMATTSTVTVKCKYNLTLL